MNSPHPAYPSRIGHDEALAIIEAAGQAHRLDQERIATRRAEGRVLASDVVAGMPLPPFDNSRMDGFAFRHGDIDPGQSAPTLQIAGEQFAGRDLGQVLAPGQCIRITTGAPMPAGADTVVMKENVDEQAAAICFREVPRLGAHVGRAGEDVRTGDTVLMAGDVLTPARTSLLTALGLADVAVSRRPTVAVFTTGDELVEPGMPLAPGEIYNSNRELLMGQLRQLGLEPTAWPSLPDDPARVRSMLLDAASAFDLIITCGGVSAGEKDYLPGFLGEAGRILFWKVRMKPGMPLLFGELESALWLALPGNPVSTLATFQAFGVPLLEQMQGRREARPRWFARLALAWSKQHPRHEFLRGKLQPREDGSLWVTPNPADASHRLQAAADSDALIVLAEGEHDYQAGDVVRVLPY
ncbi:molybdopterin molybdotransferase MoeA [Pseudoxanthomonas indica]|uniref:Molybdopterin molybdenumtransferase n=1 Tax=Pseudoxanthomonas indica TaxID=428993 RepID=A0A1T5LZ83_9GAMM|nr:gephyrin-like molybdotransferase Glp [Pseudoxanthomonas indica]GGD42744.1 molybdopterin molybdenumtransferase MoeA [Pseudoxanthomonas indica]SKC81183.1 molybdopterin molybdochelatase [Pseudoxanthomonas indica]